MQVKQGYLLIVLFICFRKGVPAGKILALTFTNKAAREMKERITRIVSPEIARYLWMGTFHSIFAKILRMEGEKLGYKPNFTIYDSSDSKSLIRTIIKELNLDDNIYKPGVIASRISSAKNNLVTSTMYATDSSMQEYDKASRMPSACRYLQNLCCTLFQSQCDGL